MKVKVVHSTLGCENSTCPTIYQNEAGNYIIQGFTLSKDDKSTLPIPKGEDAIEVPAEFIQAFIAKQK